ncbi:MAG: TonB-dependent receptor, partial [Vicinamibacterales bacterium]|nr:TonB-dependent receptor [Vicinamibacterales bacterium]
MRRIVLIIMLAAMCTWPAAAQETRGALQGVVKDTQGGVLPGATVELKGATGTQVTTTDDQGVYRFPALEPGVYEITASLEGFTSARNPGVSLAVGVLLKVDLKLALGGVSETVDVSANAATIDVKQTTAATNLLSDAIDRLPKGRDFQSVVTLAPGANQESRSGGLSVDGASASENKYYLDGIDTTNLRSGLSATPFLTDFIQEVQVKSSGHAAEFGGATGGVVSVISRSGTNLFRGEVGAYVNTSAMNGDLALNSTDLLARDRSMNAVRALRLVLTGANAAETVEYNKDTFSRWDPHGQLGGPILKEKLWFWAGYTPQIENTKRTVTFRSTGLPGSYTSKETTQNLVGNLTWQVTPAIRAKVSGQRQPYTQDGRLPAVDGTSNPRTAFASLGLEQTNLAGTGSLDWVASNRLFFNAKMNYLTYDTKDIGIPDDIWYTFNGSNLGIETRPDMVQSHNYNSVLTNRARARDKYWRVGGTADATMYITAGGQHTIKAGAQFERIGNDVADIEQQPHVTVAWNQARTTLAGPQVRGQYGYWSWRQFGTLGKVTVDNLGLFFQ